MSRRDRIVSVPVRSYRQESGALRVGSRRSTGSRRDRVRISPHCGTMPMFQGDAMALSFHSRAVGGITIVKCEGRIVEGPDSAALRRHVNDILEKRSAVLLNLGGVEFIDSAGLGVLVRILARAGQDSLKLCALSPKLADVLRITKLSTVFDCHESEAEAIAA